jgi:hypothetical protein
MSALAAASALCNSHQLFLSGSSVRCLQYIGQWEVYGAVRRRSLRKEHLMSSAQSKYCKAYVARDLKSFEPWNESMARRQLTLDDEAVLYLHDNYVVRDGIFPDDKVIFDVIDEDWKEFCHSRLAFQVSESAA